MKYKNCVVVPLTLLLMVVGCDKEESESPYGGDAGGSVGQDGGGNGGGEAGGDAGGNGGGEAGGDAGGGLDGGEAGGGDGDGDGDGGGLDGGDAGDGDGGFEGGGDAGDGDGDGDAGSSCNSFLQDCPEGEKCVPYNSDGDNTWDTTKCVEVVGSGTVGDDCEFSDPLLSVDNCDQDSFCWNYKTEEDKVTGTCAAFCQGTPDAPVCDSGTSCFMADGTISLCLDTCDPVIQDCGDGQGCYWNPPANQFQCLYLGANLGVGEECGFSNDCAAGNVCLAAELSPDCSATFCCVALCDLGDSTCPTPGTECKPWWDEDGTVPPGLEHVGHCTVP